VFSHLFTFAHASHWRPRGGRITPSRGCAGSTYWGGSPGRGSTTGNRSDRLRLSVAPAGARCRACAAWWARWRQAARWAPPRTRCARMLRQRRCTGLAGGVAGAGVVGVGVAAGVATAPHRWRVGSAQARPGWARQVGPVVGELVGLLTSSRPAGLGMPAGQQLGAPPPRAQCPPGRQRNSKRVGPASDYAPPSECKPDFSQPQQQAPAWGPNYPIGEIRREYLLGGSPGRSLGTASLCIAYVFAQRPPRSKLPERAFDGGRITLVGSRRRRYLLGGVAGSGQHQGNRSDRLELSVAPAGAQCGRVCSVVGVVRAGPVAGHRLARAQAAPLHRACGWCGWCRCGRWLASWWGRCAAHALPGWAWCLLASSSVGWSVPLLASTQGTTTPRPRCPPGRQRVATRSPSGQQQAPPFYSVW
jgi:hypothetical protein